MDVKSGGNLGSTLAGFEWLREMPTNLPSSPTLYEIDTRAWLDALGRRAGGGPLRLDQVPDEELDRLAAFGFAWVWLLGVWQTGDVGRAWSQADADAVRHYRGILPDFHIEDVAGSMFAIKDYAVSDHIGGDAALAGLRARLHARGMRLMLDFVPNHTARDHPWVSSHPYYYVQGHDDDLAREPKNYGRAANQGVFAYGRDPYFPGWGDTFQLNYRHPALRAAMAGELARVAGVCDGVRCDMAMLVLPEIFLSTWADRARPRAGLVPDDRPFWPSAIAQARAVNPELFLLAEVYWGLEDDLLRQGFDCVYDKALYDRLRDRDASAVRAHLRADPDSQRNRARFLENHDEERAAAVFPDDVHRAAAVLTYLAPGLRFFHEGQLDGRRVRPSVHLARRPDDPPDPELPAFYSRLLDLLKCPEASRGDWRLLEPRPAWHDNPTWERFVAFERLDENHRWLIVVNYGYTEGQCFVPLSIPGSPGAVIRFRDRLSPAIYDRDAADLAARGLYLDMPAWGYHVFELEERNDPQMTQRNTDKKETSNL